MITFSNPRLCATFTDWPLGGNKRGPCYFNVQTGSKGARVERITTGKPKYSTYHTRCCIVDGSDGRTYLLCESIDYGHAVNVKRSDFMDAAGEMGLISSYFRKDQSSNPDPEKAQAESAMFNTLKELIDRAYQAAKKS